MLQNRQNTAVLSCAGILEQSTGSMNQVGRGLQATQAGGFDSLESIPGLLKILKIPSQATQAGGINSLDSIPGFY
jgi:hypothetical protein